MSFLSDIVREIKGPVTYKTLAGTGHYCGVVNLYGSRLVFYNKAMFEPFYQTMIDFLEQASSGAGQAYEQ